MGETMELTSWELIGVIAAMMLVGLALRFRLKAQSIDPDAKTPLIDEDDGEHIPSNDGEHIPSNDGKHFPWDDVRQCYDRKIEPMNGSSCPSCNLPGNQLLWIDFVSPPWTWKNLCGREGYLSICERCHVQVDFWMTGMN